MNDVRAIERFDLEFPMMVKGVDVKGKLFEEFTNSLNISSKGAYFLVRSEVKLREQLSASITLPRKKMNLIDVDGLVVRVNHLNHGKDKKQGVAIEFDSNLSKEESRND